LFLLFFAAAGVVVRSTCVLVHLSDVVAVLPWRRRHRGTDVRPLLVHCVLLVLVISTWLTGCCTVRNSVAHYTPLYTRRQYSRLIQ